MRNAKRWFGLAASILVLILASGMAQAHEEDFGVISGTVSYRPRIFLPDSAEVQVQLWGISQADTPAVEIASQTILTNGRQVPLEYWLTYDLASIHENGTYAISASIRVDGTLMWISNTRYEVISNGEFEAELNLIQTPLPEGTRAETTTEPVEAMSFGAVTGTVTYLQRIALSENALVLVELSDISVADAPAFVLASQQFVTNGRQVPFSFALNYDPESIVENGIYSISARIFIGGELAWISDAVTPVISNGVFDAEVVLVQA